MNISRILLFCFLYISFVMSSIGYSSDSIAVAKGGVGLGTIKLGDSIETTVKKMNKKPTEGKTVITGKTEEYWLSYKEQGITFVFSSNQSLNRIIVTNPGIVLKDTDIRVNSLSTGLKDYKGMVEDVKESGQIKGRYMQKFLPSHGASFMINKDTEKIETITIMPKTNR